MQYTLLPSRSIIAVSGADAENFLQGLISNDIRKLLPDKALYAALLSPQGKFLHDFFLYRRGDAILLDCDKARISDLMSRLALYKLRAQVTIEALPDAVMAAWGGTTDRGFPDPRLAGMGYRIIGETDVDDWQKTDIAAYEKHRIALGVPDGAQDAIVDRSFLLELGFEALSGVDFGKGCYVGQEVTARSKFRGQVRKHLYQVRADAELPPPGSKIMQNGTEVGEMRSHVTNIGLAILRIEAVENNQPLLVHGMPVTASLPAWLRAAA